MSKYYYYLDRDKLEDHINYVLGISDYKTTEYDGFEYYGEKLLSVPVIDGDNLREATRLERVEWGFETLKPYEYIKNGVIKSWYDVPVPAGFIRPEFDELIEQWRDVATQEEIDVYEEAKAKSEIDQKVRNYSDTKSRFELGYITQEELDAIKVASMKAE